MRHVFDYIKKHPFLLFLIVPAFFLYMSLSFPNGSNYCYQEKCGIYFWGVHGHDAIWHLALIENSFKQFPFVSPIFSGAQLSGYNYLFDLIIFLLIVVTPFSSLVIFFKIIPIFWFIAFTVLAIKLARKINDDKVFVSIFLFFLFFSSSFTYILTLIKDKTIIGSAGLLSQQIFHTMYNTQYALSIVIILYLLVKIVENEINLRTVLILGLLTFINMGLKFYGGAVTLVLCSLFILSKSCSIKLKKTIFYLLIILMFFGISILLFYSPFTSSKTGSIFGFAPFALVHPITEDPGLFYQRNLTDARYFLMTKGLGPKLIFIEAINLTLFLFFYMGVRFFGLIYLGGKIITRKYKVYDLIILGTMIIATVTSLILVQKAEWWNTIQFFYYAIFLSNIYLAEFVYLLYQKKNIFTKLLIVLIFLLAIPTTVDIAISSFKLFPGGTYVPKEEVEALQYLKKQPKGVVYSPFFNDKTRQNQTVPIPLYADGDTSYITAFSSQISYFNDLVQIRLTGIDYKKRMQMVLSNDCRILKEIDYIYYNNNYKISHNLFDCPNKLEFLWGNRTATIYKVKH